MIDVLFFFSFFFFFNFFFFPGRIYTYCMLFWCPDRFGDDLHQAVKTPGDIGRSRLL